MAVTESLEEASSNSLSSGTASGEPPGGRSLLDLETPCSVPQRPPISRTEAGTLWMQCFQHDFTSLWMCHWHFTHGLLFESPIFFCSRLKKKKKPFKKLTDHKDGVSLPWETTVSIWTPGPDVPFDSALFHTRVSLLR